MAICHRLLSPPLGSLQLTWSNHPGFTHSLVFPLSACLGFLQIAGAGLVTNLGTQHGRQVVLDKDAHTGVVIVCPSALNPSSLRGWPGFNFQIVGPPGPTLASVSARLPPREAVFGFSSRRCILCLASVRCSWNYYFLTPAPPASNLKGHLHGTSSSQAAYSYFQIVIT